MCSLRHEENASHGVCGDITRRLWSLDRAEYTCARVATRARALTLCSPLNPPGRVRRSVTCSWGQFGLCQERDLFVGVRCWRRCQHCAGVMNPRWAGLRLVRSGPVDWALEAGWISRDEMERDMRVENTRVGWQLGLQGGHSTVVSIRKIPLGTDTGCHRRGAWMHSRSILRAARHGRWRHADLDSVGQTLARVRPALTARTQRQLWSRRATRLRTPAGGFRCRKTRSLSLHQRFVCDVLLLRRYVPSFTAREMYAGVVRCK